MSDSLNAILHPFAKGLLPLPDPGRGVFLRAQLGSGVDEVWQRGLICAQSFKPDHDALSHAGFKTTPEIEGGSFDLGLCLLSKHKGENLSHIAQLWELVRPGGMIVCAGRIDTGAASIARMVEQAAGSIEMLAKYHCKVFWFTRSAEKPPEFAAWAESGQLQLVPETGYFSRPGLYSWNKIDRGSALLIEHLPSDLTGRVADLGAGWGYLSGEIVKRCPAITSLDLFEAEARALEAAKANLDGIASGATLRYHWHDVRGGVGSAQFDAIVMNPPFHEGKDTDMALGQAFIASAAEALVPGGRLFMVANRQLPYEQVIKSALRKNKVLAETGIYKVFEAVR